MPSPVVPILEVGFAEREVLERWLRRPKTGQDLALRARIVLACASGVSNCRVAAEVGTHRTTVQKWRKRFLERRLDGLLDEPRPGAPRTTHWSTRSMARHTGMSQSAVSRIWRAFVLQPHRSETFKLSKDPLFIEKWTSGSTPGSSVFTWYGAPRRSCRGGSRSRGTGPFHRWHMPRVSAGKRKRSVPPRFPPLAYIRPRFVTGLLHGAPTRLESASDPVSPPPRGGVRPHAGR